MDPITEAKDSMKGMLNEGRQLVTASAEQGGWAEYFTGDMALSEGSIEDWTPEEQYRAACTAIWMENTRQWHNSLDEATRAIQVGGFIDYLYPMIRAAMTNNPIMSLVSVQPMTRKLGQIFFLNYIIGQNKGSYTKGERIFDALEGYAGGHTYTDETIDSEPQPDAAAAAAQSFVLSYTTVRRGTVEVSIDGGTLLVARDDGNGAFTKVSGSATIASSSINYQTGAVTITLGAAATGGESITATYEYDSEVSTNLPQIDVQLTSVGVQAKARRLRMRYSQDAAYDFRQEFGQDVDSTLVAGAADLVRAEMGREVIRDLWNGAGAPVASFDINGGTGISRAEHFTDLLYTLNQADQQIYEETQRVHGNWIVVDANAASVIRTIPAPTFQAAPIDNSTQGIQYLGRLAGQWDVWVDKYIATEPGAVANGNILMGHRGADFFDAGYVVGMYQPIYTTTNVTLDDFLTRKGLATRYAKKMVNPRQYKRISLTAS